MGVTKVSKNQLFAMVSIFTIGTTVISAPGGVASLAKQDAWISALIAPLFGMLFILLYYHLGKLCPGKTLIEMLLFGFGKIVGWIIGLFFVLFVCFLDVAQVVSYVGDFVRIEYMTETPLYALNFILMIGIVIGLIYGLEVIARASEVFVVFVTAILILTLLLSVTNIKTENVLPIFEEGILPVLKGTLYLSSYMTWPIIVLMMIYPIDIADTENSLKPMLKGYLLGAGINFLCTLMCIFILGSTLTARTNYPTYILAKEIDLGIITRIEGAVSGAWIITQFIKASLYFYAGAKGLSQLLGLKDYKKIIIPLGLVLYVYSGVVYPTAAYQTEWDSTTWIPFIGSFGAIMPFILLIALKIKTQDEPAPPPK